MRRPRRTDADRRVRQCERLGRLLRLLHLIMGRGRWDADTLAEELCCSRRTIFRLFQTLSYAGVPWYFDEAKKAYRVRPGFKFPGIEEPSNPTPQKTPLSPEMAPVIEKMLAEGEAFSASLNEFLKLLQQDLNPSRSHRSPTGH